MIEAIETPEEPHALGPLGSGRYLAHHTHSARSLGEILDSRSLESANHVPGVVGGGAGVSFSVHPYWGHALRGHKHVSGPTLVFHRHAIRARTPLETPTYLVRPERRAGYLADRFGDINVTHHPHEAGEKMNRKYGPQEGELVSSEDPVEFEHRDLSHILYHHNAIAAARPRGRYPDAAKVREQIQDRDMLQAHEHAKRHGVPFFVATHHPQNAERIAREYPELRGKIVRTSSTEWRKSDLAQHYLTHWHQSARDAYEALLDGAPVADVITEVVGLQRRGSSEYLLDPTELGDVGRELYRFKSYPNQPRWGTTHEFAIIHPEHGDIGQLHVAHTKRGTKRLYVPWMQLKPEHEHAASMQGIRSSLQAHFPHAEEVRAWRVTGRKRGVKSWSLKDRGDTRQGKLFGGSE